MAEFLAEFPVARAARRVCAVLVCGAVVVMVAAPAAADEQADPPTRQVETLEPAVARDLLDAYELLQEGRDQKALDELNQLMAQRGDDMKPFDRASVLQVRGSAQVSVGNLGAAIRDFEQALELNALPDDQNLQLRFNVAQLHFQQENYREAIRYFERWFEQAEDPGANAYYQLAAAHYFLDDYRAALEPIERALELAGEPRRQHYDMANILYSELDRPGTRVALLGDMIEIWPNEAAYWKQLASLHSGQGNTGRAFSVLELAWLNGLIDDESDLLTLAQYYSVFDNHYRGAVLLEQEIEAGNVARNVENLELLSQLWSQAREHDKAIPVLREAAELAETGMLWFRLGQAHLARNDHPAAERALVAALDRGGLDPSIQGEAWLLLGNVRFSEAGPGDRDQRAAADRAFAEAERFAGVRDRAGQWREYIRAIDDTESRQAQLEEQQRIELARATRLRLRSACQAERLSGAPLSEECEAFFRDEEAGIEDQ